MRETAFKDFLVSEPTIHSEKAVTSRIAKANKAESLLGKDLNVIVSDDDLMYESLLELQKNDNAHNSLQNALRKYYKFVRNKEFPRLRHYHSAKHP